MSVLDKLTEGIVNRNLQNEGAALLSKWEKTGLLEGLDGRNKDTMSVLLENQAKELLRESSTMAAGDVEGFASVAFPIVRRVFGKLIANELVSVQPMSLPSGLIFFLDFKFSSDTTPRYDNLSDESLYGGGRLGRQITGGIDLTTTNAEKGFYNLNNAYSSPTGSNAADNGTAYIVMSGTYGGDTRSSGGGTLTAVAGAKIASEEMMKLCRFDPDFTSGTTTVAVSRFTLSELEGDTEKLNKDNLIAISASLPEPLSGHQVRRLTQFSGSSKGTGTETLLIFCVSEDGSIQANSLSASLWASGTLGVSFPLVDVMAGNSGEAIGAIIGTSLWGLEANTQIPEIDINVDSVSITAITKKLKAKWSPELGQDLNAYHNLDAEVELTSILSEQVALEIDQEILEDLLKGATAGTYYWSRRPGRFLTRDTGVAIGAGLANESLLGADFTGNVSEWYETLVETINDVSAQIHRKTLRGGANFLVCSPEVANILEFTSGFRASVTHDDDKGSVGAIRAGSLSKKWDVWVDPYFPRNVILVGRRGSSFLESGYVYAPYVPLQVTPTIFGPEDFVPRKGVMTRYGKKMVRPDFYGVVIVDDLLG